MHALADERPDGTLAIAFVVRVKIDLTGNIHRNDRPSGLGRHHVYRQIVHDAAIDQQVRALAGSDALTQEFYAVAGQILTELVQNTGGDAQKMLQAVERAKTDPAGFATMLSPATLQRLRDLSVKLSDQKR